MIDLKKCRMTRYPAPLLALKAKSIEKIDDDIRRLSEKMLDIMIENKGVGLAGPQAGVSLQIFVVSIDGSKENAKVYINPHIETAGTLDDVEEGCLSVPGIYPKIKRYKKCSVTALGLDGKEFTETGEGLLARAFQHEFDHLQGTLIADRMSAVARIAARSRLKQLREEYQNNNTENKSL
jgi:peptide deformylase